MKKRITAIFLTLCLILSVMPMTAFAAETVQLAETQTEDESSETATLYMRELYLTIYYKNTEQLHTEATGGKVIYESSNPRVVTVDKNGKLTTVRMGHAFVTATVEGTDVSRACEISVEYTWQQWIINLLFFGCMWY